MKYVEIAKMYLKTQLAYRFDMITGAMFLLSKVLLAFILWSAIFAGRETVGGFTYPEMISYYIICSFLRELDMSDSSCGEFAGRIRGGQLSAHMTWPVSLQGYFIAQTSGVEIIYGAAQLIMAVLCVLIFRVKLVFCGDAALLCGAAVMAAMGLVCMMALNFLVSMLAYKYNDVNTFCMVKDNIVYFITGSIIPLALFPEWITSAMRFLPFYYVAYLPSMLFTGKCAEQMLPGLLILTGWTAFLLLIGGRVYEKYRVKYDGVGI